MVEWRKEIIQAVVSANRHFLQITPLNGWEIVDLDEISDIWEYEEFAALGEIKENEKQQFSEATLKSIALLDKSIVFYRYLCNASA